VFFEDIFKIVINVTEKIKNYGTRWRKKISVKGGKKKFAICPFRFTGKLFHFSVAKLFL
jgi:hypothetical protein